MFQGSCTCNYSFTQQPWQTSKIHSCLSRLVHMMAYLMTCIERLSGIVMQFDKPFLKSKTDCKNGIIFYTFMQGHYESIPSENQKTIPHCSLECVTRFTDSSSYRCTHICKIENIQRILFFPWLIHILDLTFLWQVKPVAVQNTSRRLIISKQAFIWNISSSCLLPGQAIKCYCWTTLSVPASRKLHWHT